MDGEEEEAAAAAARRRLAEDEERWEEGARCEGNASELDLDLHIAPKDGGGGPSAAACGLRVATVREQSIA